jgi:O-antigen/teichoic acid export membrane protein
VAIGYILFGVASIFSAGVHLQRKGKWFWIFSSLGAAVNVGLNFLFIPRYGMMAAAFTTMLAFTVQPIGYYWITKKKYPITLPWQEIIRLLFLCGIFSCISYYIVIDNLLFAFIVKAFLMIMFLTILYFINIILPDDKKKVIQYLRWKLAFRE